VTFGPGGGYAPAIDKSKRPAAQLTPQDQARAAAANEDQAASHNPAALRDELSGAHFWRVGGVGVFAYSEDSQVESQRRSVWSEFSKAHGREAWLHTARIRTDVYNSGQMQVRPLIRWHLVEGNAPLPNDVLLAGQEADGKNLYAARVWHGNGLHLGK
jgi:hypothetical protein